jgi:hypothetical protein
VEKENDLQRLGERIEASRRSNGTAEPASPPQEYEISPTKRRLTLFVVALVGLALIFWWPVPQMLESRETARENALKEAQLRSDAERQKKEFALREQLVEASDRELRDLIRECRQMIYASLAGEPFEPYIADYSPKDLRRLGDSAMGLRMKLGRLSTVLDGDPIERNLSSIRRSPSSDIIFVVEGASEGWSGPARWAAIYNCETSGLQIKDVRRGDSYMLD